MEKKAYIPPQMRIYKIEQTAPLCSSNPIRSSGITDAELGYGGVDEGGILDPSAKMRGGSEYNRDSWRRSLWQYE